MFAYIALSYIILIKCLLVHKVPGDRVVLQMCGCVVQV